ERAAVAGGALRGEPGDPRLPAGGDQVLEQEGGQASAPVVAVDHERHLGLVGAPEAVVATHPHDGVVDQGDEAHVVVVGADQAGHLVGGQRGLGREVPVVEGLGRLTLVEGHHAAAVGGG